MKYSVLLFLVISLSIHAQTELYTSDSKNRFTLAELEMRIDSMQSTYDKIAVNPRYFIPEIANTEYRGDTILHSVIFQLVGEKPEKQFYKNPIEKLLGKQLLDFNLLSLQGKTVSLKDVKGKPTLVSFWFINCPPCLEEIPLLNTLKENHSDKFNFISITFQEPQSITEFLETREFNFTHLPNAERYIEDLGVAAYPTNLVLDKNGIVRYVAKTLKSSEKTGVDVTTIDSLLTVLNSLR